MALRIKYPSKVSVRSVMNALKRVPSRISSKGSREIKRLWLRNWRAGLDPYGIPWAPYTDASIRRGRRRPLLVDTRRLINSLEVTPLQSAGIRISIGGNPVPLAFHQRGTSRMVARQVVPSAARGGLPPAWRARLRAIARDAFGAVR